MYECVCIYFFFLPEFARLQSFFFSFPPPLHCTTVLVQLVLTSQPSGVTPGDCIGNLTLTLSGWWWLLWAGSGCGGSGRAPGWCGWAVASLLWCCCAGAVCWRQAISLPEKSVIVGEVGQCVGVRWRAGVGVGVLRTEPVAADVRIYSIVSHL